MAIIKILHAVSALLGAAHVCFAVALSSYFDFVRPHRPDVFTGAVRPWGDDETRVYITLRDEDVFWGLAVVGAVSLAVCGVLTLVLKHDARREGRTTLY
ncbi:hypothetical protein [Dongia sp. agr-C8]